MRVQGECEVNLKHWHVPSNLIPLRKLGEGAFGQVWLVQRADTDDKFALKLFRPIDGMQVERARRRFVRGAELMRDQLAHPNIVKVYAVYGANTDTPAFLMDFVDGPDLRAFRTNDASSLDALLDVMSDVIGAVESAHSQDVVHRDIKPRNILIRRDGDTFRGVLTDFDLAYQPNQNITAMAGTTQSIAQTGTYFMHPEFREHFDRYADPAIQIAARHRSLDYYSLCATLYFTITGQDPSNESRMAKVLGDAEEATRNQIGAHGTESLFRLVSDTLSCAAVAEVPQTVSDLSACIKDARTQKHAVSKGVAALAMSITGGRLRNATQLRAEYGVSEKLTKLKRTVALQRWFSLTAIAVGLLSWLLGGKPVAITGLTVLALARMGCGQRLLTLAQSIPAALPPFTERIHWVFHLTQKTSWAIMLWHLVAMGAFVFVPSLQPWFVDFRTTMVALRAQRHPELAKQIERSDAEPQPPAPREPPQPGDVVTVLDVDTPAKWRLRSSGVSLPSHLWGIEDFVDRPDSAARVSFIKERLGLGSERLPITVKLGPVVESRDAVRLFVQGSDVGAWLLAEGLVRTQAGIQLPTQYGDAQRAAEEMGLGAWRQSDCQIPCSMGSGCREARQLCQTGWHCVPQESGLARRRWELLLLGAEVGGGLSEARVCVGMLGRRGCATAQEAANSGSGKELGLTFTTDQLNTSRATISLEAMRGQDVVPLMNMRKTLKVVPLSICSGFSIRSEAGGVVRLKLREAKGLR